MHVMILKRMAIQKTKKVRASFAVASVQGCSFFAQEHILTPNPKPQNSLQRISLCNQVLNGNSYYGKENLVGAKTPSTSVFCTDFHSLAKGKPVSLVRIHFSHPESDGNRQTLGVGVDLGYRDLRIRLLCAPTTPP